jgi:hypothetical protein
MTTTRLAEPERWADRRASRATAEDRLGASLRAARAATAPSEALLVRVDAGFASAPEARGPVRPRLVAAVALCVLLVVGGTVGATRAPLRAFIARHRNVAPEAVPTSGAKAALPPRRVVVEVPLVAPSLVGAAAHEPIAAPAPIAALAPAVVVAPAPAVVVAPAPAVVVAPAPASVAARAPASVAALVLAPASVPAVASAPGSVARASAAPLPVVRAAGGLELGARAEEPGAARAPALPVVAAPPAGDVSPAAEETRRLRRVFYELRKTAGGADAALAALDDYDRLFPAGLLRDEARLARVEALLALGRGAEALTLLDAARGLPREARVARGELRAEAGRCDEAVADFNDVLATSSSDERGARALFGLASCALRAGDEAGAGAALARYLDGHPDGARVVEVRAALARLRARRRAP